MMEKPSNDRPTPEGKSPAARRPRPSPWLFVIVALVVMLLFTLVQAPKYSFIEDYGYFEQLVRDGRVQRIELGEEEATGIFKDPPPMDSELDSQGKPRKERKQLAENFRIT